VGQLVHTLPEGPPVLGVALLAGEIYLLRHKKRNQVEVYDVVTYHLQRRLTVPDIRGVVDMTSCEYNRCVYIGDHVDDFVHRLDVDVQGVATRWAVNDAPWGLSVNAAHNVIVTCPVVRKVKEFGSHGNLVRELEFSDDIITPWHVIQTRSGQFVVCHGNRDDPVNRVCMMSDDGRYIVHSHGGEPGSDIGRFHVPRHLAVDDNEFAFVADINNLRVTLLSPTLEYVRQVVSRDQLKWLPGRLSLDRERRHLCVADNEWNGEQAKYIAGRVVVFSV